MILDTWYFNHPSGLPSFSRIEKSKIQTYLLVLNTDKYVAVHSDKLKFIWGDSETFGIVCFEESAGNLQELKREALMWQWIENIPLSPRGRRSVPLELSRTQKQHPDACRAELFFFGGGIDQAQFTGEDLEISRRCRLDISIEEFARISGFRGDL